MTIVKKILLYLIVITAIVLCFVILVHAFYYSASADISVPIPGQPNVSKTVATNTTPMRIIIPVINVDAVIQQVGIAKNGNIAVPTNFTDTGWYKYGITPGQVGSAIIDGHVNNGLSLPAVFATLNQLKPGDDIYIITQDIATLHFIMTSSHSYLKNAATDTILNDKSGSLLKLITCTGTWLPLQRTHDQRLVVTAVLQK